MRPWARAVMAFAILMTFIVGGLPTASANPAIPYCPTTIGGATSQTGVLTMPEQCEAVTGRVFPEAIEDDHYIEGMGPNGFTGTGPIAVQDYIGYFEFQAGLQYLAANNPDYIEIHEVAMSHGYENSLGPARNPVYILEITNEKSPIAREDKLNLLFMLSIHGNEKGGREGGFRVLEDLLKNIGFATETVQQGAGIPGGLEKPTGGEVQTYMDYLDFMTVYLLFPNTDGWVCDEVEYAAGGCPGLFNRGNSQGTDLNRQTPTIGWHNVNRQVLGEPESGGDPESGLPGFANWLVQQREAPYNLTWNYAIDIHGMLNHKNFGAIMLPAGSMTPQEMHRSLRLAETLKERWNADAGPGGHFEEWGSAFSTAEDIYGTAGPVAQGVCDMVDCPLPGSALGENPAHQASSSQFAEYYTVIDAIGYTDSGFNGDFFAQSTGLNAPGYDIELAYNHLNCSAQYQNGACALFNDYHVWMVRHIVKSFMDAAALDVKISYETGGSQAAYVVSPYVATNLDDEQTTPGGWADQTPNDDAWDYGEDTPFTSSPSRYWSDIAPFLCEGCGSDGAVPGTLTPVQPATITLAAFQKVLDNHDTLVIPGSGINQFFLTGTAEANKLPALEDGSLGELDQAKIDALLAWIAAGGNLVLTDAALSFFDLAGITKDAVSVQNAYMGGIRMDLEHPMLEKVRGGVKQTYEPTPLGWGTSGAAPNWGIDPAKFGALDGASVAGYVCGGSQLTQNCNSNDIALGYLDLGEGRIQFMGAVLPDASEEFYHPYGLDDYATTYSGNQIIRNMLGWDEVFAAPPVIIEGGKVIQAQNEPGATTVAEDEDTAGSNNTPGLGIVLLLGAIAVALFSRRR